MTNMIFRREINNNYPKLGIVNLKKTKSIGVMNNIFIGENHLNKYIIKVYRSDNLKKIINEHKILHLINGTIPNITFYLSNKNSETYTFSNKLKKYYGIYKYIDGTSPNSLKETSLLQIKEIAKDLKRINVLLLNIKNIDKDIIHRNIKTEFKNNINKLKNVLNFLKNKKTLNRKEEVIKIVLLKKIKQISKNDFYNIKIISQSLVGIIHGDFAPTNLIFNGNTIEGILDWENACFYNHVWEVFRSMCYCSSKNSFGIICSELDKGKIMVFLKSYFSKGSVFQKREIEALKLMPKYYYFLDPYIISSYCLDNNKKIGKLISIKTEDHFWLENYYDEFILLVNKYADQRK